jgi:hypothetical protein
MARTWLSVTVELLGGRGEELWPWPGRVMAVGPSHTFRDLAQAINTAFARWGRPLPSVFTLADGSVVADPRPDAEPDGPHAAPGPRILDMTTTEAGRTLRPGDEFRFVVDTGDTWTHRCVVEATTIDPADVLGSVPDTPLPYRGWGTIPDQRGRRWADDDGGRMPPRPRAPHPMFSDTWPHTRQQDPVDVTEVRTAVRRKDPAAFLDAVDGKDLDQALQQVGLGLPMALEQQRERAEPITEAVVRRLDERGGAGDDVLAEDLRTRLAQRPLPGRMVTTDMDFLAEVVDGMDENSMGGVLDLTTGEVYADFMLEDGVLGDDTPDPDEDPDRWLGLGRTESREAWQDMADFAASRTDPGLRDRLGDAIQGRGAFRRFRDRVHDEGLADQWDTFSTDRSYGRAREELARSDVHVA